MIQKNWPGLFQPLWPPLLHRFAVIVWFNTNLYTVSFEAKMVVYLAPIVLAVLMGVLVWLSQPPKKTEAPAPDSAEPEAETSTSK